MLCSPLRQLFPTGPCVKTPRVFMWMIPMMLLVYGEAGLQALELKYSIARPSGI